MNPRPITKVKLRKLVSAHLKSMGCGLGWVYECRLFADVGSYHAYNNCAPSDQYDEITMGSRELWGWVKKHITSGTVIDIWASKASPVGFHRDYTHSCTLYLPFEGGDGTVDFDGYNMGDPWVANLIGNSK